MTYIKKIVDVTTGKETFEPYTAEEKAEVENTIKLAEADRKAAEADAKAKAEAKEALLAKLGITAEEAVLLLG